MAFYTLGQMIGLFTQWEEELYAFYDMMEEYLRDERSRETAYVLQRGQVKALEVLKNIDPKDYDHSEYIKNVPDYHSEDVIPHFEMSADSSPREVFETVLGFEEKLEEFYTHMRDLAVFTKSKELFDMLIQFKMGQIKEIKAYMDSFDLAV